MKLTPQHLGKSIGDLQTRIEKLEVENEMLFAQVDYFKEIFENALVKNNPDYKRRKVLKEMDDFLGQKIGRTRTPN